MVRLRGSRKIAVRGYSIVAMSFRSASIPTSARFDSLTAVVFSVIVGVCLLVPGDSIHRLDGGPWPLPAHADKMVHGALFLIEAHVLRRYLRWRVGAARALPLAVAGSLAFAGCSELAQLVIPFRSADGWDLLADAAGILAYAAVVSRSVRQ